MPFPNDISSSTVNSCWRKQKFQDYFPPSAWFSLLDELLWPVSDAETTLLTSYRRVHACCIAVACENCALNFLQKSYNYQLLVIHN